MCCRFQPKIHIRESFGFFNWFSFHAFNWIWILPLLTQNPYTFHAFLVFVSSIWILLLIAAQLLLCLSIGKLNFLPRWSLHHLLRCGLLPPPLPRKQHLLLRSWQQCYLSPPMITLLSLRFEGRHSVSKYRTKFMKMAWPFANITYVVFWSLTRVINHIRQGTLNWNYISYGRRQGLGRCLLEQNVFNNTSLEFWW